MESSKENMHNMYRHIHVFVSRHILNSRDHAIYFEICLGHSRSHLLVCACVDVSVNIRSFVSVGINVLSFPCGAEYVSDAAFGNLVKKRQKGSENP